MTDLSVQYANAHLIADAAVGPTVAEIKRVVAADFGVRPLDIDARYRNAKSIIPRFAAIYLSVILKTTPYKRIGVYFGNRDRTTITHAFKRMQDFMAKDPELAAKIEALAAKLRG